MGIVFLDIVWVRDWTIYICQKSDNIHTWEDTWKGTPRAGYLPVGFISVSTLVNSLFGLKSKKTSKLQITGPFWGESTNILWVYYPIIRRILIIYHIIPNICWTWFTSISYSLLVFLVPNHVYLEGCVQVRLYLLHFKDLPCSGDFVTYEGCGLRIFVAIMQ